MGTTLAIPADPPLVESSPQVMQAFCIDMAQQIHEYATIAERYAFTDEQALFNYLSAREPVRRRIRELRAVWESDENVETRIRLLASHTVLEAIPSTGGILFNEALNPSVRIDALKAHARIAGVDAVANNQSAVSGGTATAGKFSVQIIFGQAGKVETITTGDTPPTIEGEAA